MSSPALAPCAASGSPGNQPDSVSSCSVSHACLGRCCATCKPCRCLVAHPASIRSHIDLVARARHPAYRIISPPSHRIIYTAATTAPALAPFSSTTSPPRTPFSPAPRLRLTAWGLPHIPPPGLPPPHQHIVHRFNFHSCTINIHRTFNAHHFSITIHQCPPPASPSCSVCSLLMNSSTSSVRCQS